MSKWLKRHYIFDVPYPEDSNALVVVVLVAETLASSVKAAREQQDVFMMVAKETNVQRRD